MAFALSALSGSCFNGVARVRNMHATAARPAVARSARLILRAEGEQGVVDSFKGAVQQAAKATRVMTTGYEEGRAVEGQGQNGAGHEQEESLPGASELQQKGQDVKETVAENSEDAAKSIEHDAKPVAEAVQEEGSNVKQAAAEQAKNAGQY